MPRVGHTYIDAKSPVYPNTPLSHLEQAYGASEFLPALKMLIQEIFIPNALLSSEHNRLDIYNSIHITHHSQSHVSNHKHHKTIYAMPKYHNGSQKQPSPAHFETALVVEDTGLHRDKEGLCGMYYILYTNFVILMITILSRLMHC